jgi:hypothetical protein
MVTAVKAAKHIFISASRFRDLVDADIIKRKPAGKYVLDEVRESYCLNAQRVMSGRSEEGGKALSQQRARLAQAQSEAAEFKNNVARGDYVSLALIQAALMAAFSTMREMILTLPGKIADALMPYSPKDRAIIDEILRSECFELLENLSEGEILRSGRNKRSVSDDANSREKPDEKTD